MNFISEKMGFKLKFGCIALVFVFVLFSVSARVPKAKVGDNSIGLDIHIIEEPIEDEPEDICLEEENYVVFNSENYTNYCNESILIEHSCETNNLTFTETECEFGCEEAICLDEPEEEEIEKNIIVKDLIIPEMINLNEDFEIEVNLDAVNVTESYSVALLIDDYEEVKEPSENSISFTVNLNEAKKYTIKIVADYLSEIEETDEDDNELEEEIDLSSNLITGETILEDLGLEVEMDFPLPLDFKFRGPEKSFVFLGKNLIANYNGDDLHYYHADRTGNVRFITDEIGNVISKLKYSPFGRTVVKTDPKDKLTFISKEETNGLMHLGARFYDPELGRFISVDPVINDGTKNYYEYSRSNPIVYLDPSGRTEARADSIYGFPDGMKNAENAHKFNHPYLKYNMFDQAINENSLTRRDGEIIRKAGLAVGFAATGMMGGQVIAMIPAGTKAYYIVKISANVGMDMLQKKANGGEITTKTVIVSAVTGAGSEIINAKIVGDDFVNKLDRVALKSFLSVGGEVVEEGNLDLADGSKIISKMEQEFLGLPAPVIGPIVGQGVGFMYDEGDTSSADDE